MLRFIKAFKEASSRTKYFFIGIIILSVMVVGSAVYAYIRALIDHFNH